MASLNKLMLIGNLTRDVEVRYTPRGAAVGEFGLAVNRKWKDDSGNLQEEVTFVDITAWGKTAELAGQYLKKGSAVFIEGRLQMDTWEDKATGQKRSKLKVVCESMQFLGGKQDGGQQHGQRRTAADSAREAQQRQRQAPPPQTDDFGDPVNDDDIPF